MPQPTDAELSLIRLSVLTDEAQAQPDLAVTAVQAEALLPIIQEWAAEIAAKPDAPTDKYIRLISSVLTEAQNAFIPGPPGNNGEKSQRPPEGGPEKIEILTMLAELIKILSH
jgi:hypothetical protein